MTEKSVILIATCIQGLLMQLACLSPSSARWPAAGVQTAHEHPLMYMNRQFELGRACNVDLSLAG